MEATPKTIRHYFAADGTSPFEKWFEKAPKEVKALAFKRLLRVEKGNLGDHKAEGKGVWVLRFDDGPGTKVYYGLTENQTIVLLLVGGDKSRQSRDIHAAQVCWEDFKRNDQ